MKNGENGEREKSVKNPDKKKVKIFFFTEVDVNTWEIEIKMWKFLQKKIDYSRCETAETARTFDWFISTPQG